MTEKRERILRTTLIIVGLIATVFSFVYYSTLKCPNDVFFGIICVIDFALFTVSVFVSLNKEIQVDRGWHVALIMLVYFASWEIAAFLLLWEKFSMDAFVTVFLISLFLSPSIILLFPVYKFIVECLETA